MERSRGNSINCREEEDVDSSVRKNGSKWVTYGERVQKPVTETHDFEDAVAISDKVIVYEHGKIAQTDLPAKIRKNPANEYVSKLIACYS
jgi:ABC-type sugar transport system ATPase subunit